MKYQDSLRPKGFFLLFVKLIIVTRILRKKISIKLNYIFTSTRRKKDLLKQLKFHWFNKSIAIIYLQAASFLC